MQSDVVLLGRSDGVDLRQLTGPLFHRMKITFVMACKECTLKSLALVENKHMWSLNPSHLGEWQRRCCLEARHNDRESGSNCCLLVTHCSREIIRIIKCLFRRSKQNYSNSAYYSPLACKISTTLFPSSKYLSLRDTMKARIPRPTSKLIVMCSSLVASKFFIKKWYYHLQIEPSTKTKTFKSSKYLKAIGKIKGNSTEELSYFLSNRQRRSTNESKNKYLAWAQRVH